MTEKTLAEQLIDVINSTPQLSNDKAEVLHSIAIELKRQDVIIDFLYEALGPANDEILEMAEEEANKIK